MGANNSCCGCWKNGKRNVYEESINNPTVEDEEYQSVIESTSVHSPKYQPSPPQPADLSEVRTPSLRATEPDTQYETVRSHFERSEESKSPIIPSVVPIRSEVYIVPSPTVEDTAVSTDNLSLQAPAMPLAPENTSSSAPSVNDNINFDAPVKNDTKPELEKSVSSTKRELELKTVKESDSLRPTDQLPLLAPSVESKQLTPIDQPQVMTTAPEQNSPPQTLGKADPRQMDKPVCLDMIIGHIRAFEGNETIGPAVLQLWSTWYESEARRFYSETCSLLRYRAGDTKWWVKCANGSTIGESSSLSLEETLWLYRFAVARRGKVPAAKAMLQADLMWREEVNAELLSSQKPTLEFKRDLFKVYPHGYYGTDYEGRPIYYDRIGSIDAKEILQKFKKEEITKYWISSYENLIRCVLPGCSLSRGKRIYRGITVLDLDGISMKTFTKARELLTSLIAISQDHYPECMERTYIIRSTWVFRTIWKLIKPLLSPETVDKVILVENGKEVDTLRSVTDMLPAFITDRSNTDIDWCLSPKGAWLDQKIPL